MNDRSTTWAVSGSSATALVQSMFGRPERIRYTLLALAPPLTGARGSEPGATVR
jgi:hypothetical protein